MPNSQLKIGKSNKITPFQHDNLLENLHLNFYRFNICLAKTYIDFVISLLYVLIQIKIKFWFFFRISLAVAYKFRRKNNIYIFKWNRFLDKFLCIKPNRLAYHILHKLYECIRFLVSVLPRNKLVYSLVAISKPFNFPSTRPILKMCRIVYGICI